MKRIHVFLLFTFFLTVLQAQKRDATVFGTVQDAISEQPVDLVTVYIEGTNIAVESNQAGFYRIKVPTGQAITVVFSRLGYKMATTDIPAMLSGEGRQIDIAMAPEESDVEVVVTESKIEEAGIIREDVTELRLLPSTTGNLESVLPSIALGTSGGTGGELSSQYNVCLLYTSPSPRDATLSRMPSSA